MPVKLAGLKFKPSSEVHTQLHNTYNGILTLLILLFANFADASPLIRFDIQQQRADIALTQFAKQAQTTLLFPFDLAQQESANALHGEYPVEIGIVKLLEGTKLSAYVNEAGLLSVKAVDLNQPDKQLTKQQNQQAEIQPAPKIRAVQRRQTESIEKIAVVGSRAAPRSIGDSALPVDVISERELQSQGSNDLLQMIKSVIPSFNVSDQPLNDAATLVRPANLRGLASDHTLVLVNGKRRHRSAVITFLGGGLSDGAQGPDISTIPVSALKQIEVLRDGAAAQYGSDAIAGVINFVLKDDSQGGLAELHYGSYYAGDGDAVKFSGNIGLPLASEGFINLSMEYQQSAPTSRSVQRDDAASLIQAGNSHIDSPIQHWGSPEIKQDFKFFANAGLELTKSSKVYWFGNYARRQVESGFYYRNPHDRDGVNRGSGIYDGAFDINGNPTDLNVDGSVILTPTLLVGDLDGVGTGLECPVVRITDNNILDNLDYALIADNHTELGNNCFAFNEIFPGGFTPRFSGTIEDASLIVGTKGTLKDDWLYDVSLNLGQNSIDFSIKDTINPSLGPLSPTEFKPGSYTQSEQTLDVDLSKAIEFGLSEPLYLAGGFQYRHETYTSRAGDFPSYQIGPLAAQGFDTGANGFPGLSVLNQKTNSRHNIAYYMDIEMYPKQELLLTAALRYERYSDFGDTTKGKLALRWQLSDVVAVRGAYSSGFKAPTIGQTTVRNVTTAFGIDRNLIDRVTLPPNDPISIQKGATELTPEASRSVSTGLIAEFDNGLFITADYYHISVTDRISITSNIKLTQSDVDALLAVGITDALSFDEISYFNNDFDTTTTGIDIVANYNTNMFNGNTQFSLAYNWTSTEVDNASDNISANRIRMLENNLPPTRYSLTANHTNGNWTVLSRINYAGSTFEDHLDSGLPIEKIGSEYTVDIELGYQVNANLSVIVGAKNALNEYPDRNLLYDSEVAGSKYPTTSAIGFNGGFYYSRAVYTF